MKFFKWIATAAAAVALLGCGGQDGDTVTAPVTVQVDTVPAGLRVTTSLVGEFAPLPDVQETTQYTFTATFSSGPDAGQSLSGTLALQDISSRPIEIQGTLYGTASLAASAERLATFDTRVNSLRATLRARVEAATADLIAEMNADAAAGLTAVDHFNSMSQFSKLFSGLNETYRSEVAAMKAQLLLESGDSESTSPDVNGEVTGISGDNGNIRLRLGVGVEPLDLKGTAAADGSMSGTFESLGNVTGTWTATPQPMPAVAAVGKVAAGLSKYGTYCANCHTDNVRRNEFNVVVGSDVARLNAALAGIGSMTFLDPVLSAQDRLDIAAYVLSAR